MASSCAVYPSSPCHFKSTLDTTFGAGDWSAPPNAHMAAAPRPPTNPTSAQKPKLSLNTTCSRSLGRSSGLRLDTLSAISPTVRNTYANGFESVQHTVQGATLAARAMLPKLTLMSPSRLQHPCVSAEESLTAVPHGGVDSQVMVGSDAPESASNVLAKTMVQSHSIPYIHQPHLRSILANSPLLQTSTPRHTDAIGLIPAGTSIMSVTVKRKRVCFADQLVEEIKTATYTAKHSDLPSRTPSPASCDQVVPRSTGVEITVVSETTVAPRCISDATRSNKISRKHADLEGDDRTTMLQTPVGGRRKRQRDWVWTLGPVEHEEDQCNVISHSTILTGSSDELTKYVASDDHPGSVTSHVLDVLKPVTALYEVVKETSSAQGLVTNVRDIVDGCLGLLQ